MNDRPQANRIDGEGERGTVLIIVVLMAFLAAVLGAAAVTRSSRESNLSGLELERQTDLEAAEAGVNDYIAKMTEDHLYFKHFVHPAESSRRDAVTNAVVAAGSTSVAWSGNAWTYPTPKNRWKPLSNGFEYNLQVTAPSTSDPRTTIIATARRSTAPRTSRAIEVVIRGSSVADFQMFAAGDVTVGAGADTYGRYYAGIDGGGVAHSITYDGNAYADVIAENVVTTGSGTVASHLKSASARAIDKNSPGGLLRTVIGAPPQFGSFSTAYAEVKRAAQSTSGGGPFVLDDATQAGWYLYFKAAGTVDVYKCQKNSGFALFDGPADGTKRPVCTAVTMNRAVPAIGAIWVQQSVMVSGTLNGRVSIGSGGDVILGNPKDAVDNSSTSTWGDILYSGPDDVLGLMATNNVIVPTWSPDTLEVHGAFLALTGIRYSAGANSSKALFKHYGATASSGTPYMSMFISRSYNYDQNLLFLQPPFFPVLEKAYTVLRYRDVTP